MNTDPSNYKGEHTENINKERFEFYNELKQDYQKSGDDIFYAFLSHIFEVKSETLRPFLGFYLREIVHRKLLTREEIASGFSKFLKVSPDLETDYPDIVEHLSSMIEQLVELKGIAMENVVWFEPPQTQNEEDLDFIQVE